MMTLEINKDGNKGKNRKWDFSTENDEPSYEQQLTITEDEIEASTDNYMDDYHKLVFEFENKTKLNKLDLSIMVFAAGIQVLRWAMISNSSFFGDKVQRPDAKDVDKFVDKIGKKAKNSTQRVVDSVPFLPPTLPEMVAGLFLHQVPYDAMETTKFFKDTYNESLFPELIPHLSGNNHRYKTLGHDPIAGFIFGTANIATSTLTKNNAPFFTSYHVRDMKIDALTSLFSIFTYTWDLLNEQPEIVGGAFITQAVHIGTDVFTKAGLPIPIINVISPETSKFLMGHKIDTYSVVRSAVMAIIINKFVEMFHKLFYNQRTDLPNLYEAKTRKVVMYSNVISSLLNSVYVVGSSDMNHFDVGGTAVALWEVLTNETRIRKIKTEFIKRELDNDFQREEDEIRQQLALYGFEY